MNFLFFSNHPLLVSLTASPHQRVAVKKLLDQMTHSTRLPSGSELEALLNPPSLHPLRAPALIPLSVHADELAAPPHTPARGVNSIVVSWITSPRAFFALSGKDDMIQLTLGFIFLN